MEYTYTSIYRFEGISPNSQGEDRIIFNDEVRGVTVLLVKDINEHCLEIDTGIACASMLLRGMFNAKKIASLPKEIQTEITKIKEERGSKNKNGAIIVIKIRGDADLNINEKLHNETDDFHVCFDAINKDTLINQHKHTVNSVVSSLSILSSPEYHAENILDYVYFRDTNGKLLFSYTMKAGNLRAIVSKNLDDAIIKDSSELISSLINNTQLKSVSRLLAQSLETTQDKFRAFLSAWSAIEIFVNKVFALYEAKFISNVADDHSSHGVSKFLERIQTVMKDKYRLTDKFTLIASFLSDDIESDINLFNRIKEQRNHIFHGQAFDEEALPVEDARRLISVYLKKHLTIEGSA